MIDLSYFLIFCLLRFNRTTPGMTRRRRLREGRLRGLWKRWMMRGGRNEDEEEVTEGEEEEMRELWRRWMMEGRRNDDVGC